MLRCLLRRPCRSEFRLPNSPSIRKRQSILVFIPTSSSMSINVNQTADSHWSKWLTWMAWIMPMWAAPRAPPPPRTRPTDSPVKRRAKREKSEWMFLSRDDLYIGSLAWNSNQNVRNIKPSASISHRYGPLFHSHAFPLLPCEYSLTASTISVVNNNNHENNNNKKKSS